MWIPDAPYYFQGKKSYSSSEIMGIILGSEQNSKVCSRVPIGVHENAVFVIDASRLKSPDDIRADDLGVWVNNGVCRRFMTCKSSGSTITGVQVLSKKDGLPSRYYQLVKS
jgi:hypothetical protein